MIALGREALAPMLAAVECVTALPLPAADLAMTPGFVSACASHTIVPYLTDGFTPLEGFPEIRALLMHDFGFVMLCQLMRTLRHEPDGRVAAEASSVGLARRFGMSRGHARNLLGIARDAGWIEAIGRGGNKVYVTRQFADLVDRWTAHDLACWSRVVRAACRSIGLQEAVLKAV